MYWFVTDQLQNTHFILSIFWTKYKRKEITKDLKKNLVRKCSKISNSPPLITKGVFIASKLLVHSIIAVDEVAEPMAVILPHFHGFCHWSLTKMRLLGQRQSVPVCLYLGVLVEDSILWICFGLLAKWACMIGLHLGFSKFPNYLGFWAFFSIKQWI